MFCRFGSEEESRPVGLAASQDRQLQIFIEHLAKLGTGVHIELTPGEPVDARQLNGALHVHLLLDRPEHRQVDLDPLSLHLGQNGYQRQLDLTGQLAQTRRFDLRPQQAGQPLRGLRARPI